MSNQHEHHEHFILPVKLGIFVWFALIIGTIITVLVAQVHLGEWNFAVAMAIATVKAALVVTYFMGMKYETNDNRVIAVSAIIFSVIFFVLTATDLFFRKDGVYVQKGDLEAWAALGADSQTLKFKKPWVSSDELVAHGKKLFDMQCATCHGSAGKGDGPASGALNPKPRNFTQASGWKNGRKPAQIYGTLQKGLGTMPSFGSLPKDDLWALAHYVSHFGPDVLKDSNADLKKVGIDPSKEDGGLGGAGSKVLPIDFAIELMSEDS